MEQEAVLQPTEIPSGMSTKRKVLNFAILGVGIGIAVAVVRFFRGKK